MQAVVGELIDNGYPGTTVEQVAARAGIAKTTIYRRWGGLDGLLADLMAEHAAHEIPVPDEGNLDADLRALARSVVTSLRDPVIRAAFASMVGQCSRQLWIFGAFARRFTHAAIRAAFYAAGRLRTTMPH
jgi:AcrR family transcriptional regulator